MKLEQIIFNDIKFLGHSIFSAATGVGKTFLCSRLIQSQTKHRKFIIFGSVAKDDPSFKNLKNKENVFFWPLSSRTQEDDEHFRLPTIELLPKYSIIVFDDIQSLPRKLKFRGISHHLNEYNLKKHM